MLSYIRSYKHARFFEKTRVVLEKHEPQANAFRTSRVFKKKIPSAYITQHCTRSSFLFLLFITYGARLPNADWLKQRALFLNHEGTLGNQEGMNT